MYQKETLMRQSSIYSKIVDNYKLLNKQLSKSIEKLKETEVCSVSNVKAWHTDYYLHTRTREFDSLIDTCFDFLSEINMKEHGIRKANHVKYDCLNVWVATYKKGDYTIKHNHYPFVWSFIYYVDVDPDQSPIVFEDNKIVYPKPGQLLMFDATLDHDVPPVTNPRTLVALNFITLPPPS